MKAALTAAVLLLALVGCGGPEWEAGELEQEARKLRPPRIAGCAPTSGPVGTLVTCWGSGLATTREVTVAGRGPARFEVVSDREVRLWVP